MFLIYPYCWINFLIFNSKNEFLFNFVFFHSDAKGFDHSFFFIIHLLILLKFKYFFLNSMRLLIEFDIALNSLLLYLKINFQNQSIFISDILNQSKSFIFICLFIILETIIFIEIILINLN